MKQLLFIFIGLATFLGCGRFAMAQNQREAHPMPYRILWTWDSWVCNPFDAKSFVSEYKKLIDFMAEHEYNGLIIWGFLDDRHGGVAAAKEVATYGKSKGVRILPGIGAGGYHGFYISQGNPLNLVTFLKTHPDLRGIPRGQDKPSAEFLCLYQPAAIDYLREGAKYLAENFDIGGVNIETNESGGIDNCSFAAEATKQEPNRLKYACSFSDMVQAVPPIYQELKKKDADAWITYATYQPPWFNRQEDGWLLKKLPEDAIAQWNMELNVNDKVAPPVKNNISLVHSGGWSYHLGPWPPTWAFTQYRCFYPDINEVRRFAQNQAKMKTSGFVVGNVGSAEMPDNEIAYVAYIEFTRNPEMSIEAFSRKFIGQMYGEKAEPLVLKLMMNQAPIHRNLEPVWRSWAQVLTSGDKRVKLGVARPDQVERLKGQIALAREALVLADEGGQKRLKTIIAVMDEYRIIGELSMREDLSLLLGDRTKMSGTTLKEAYGKLADAAKAAGLTDEIYQYLKIGR